MELAVAAADDDVPVLQMRPCMDWWSDLVGAELCVCPRQEDTPTHVCQPVAVTAAVLPTELAAVVLPTATVMEAATRELPMEDIDKTASTALTTPSAASVADFISSMTLPPDEPVLQAQPRQRRSRITHDEWQSCRSERLAAKSAYRDPHPEKQACRVLLSKWEGRDHPNTPDPTIATRFQETFDDSIPTERRNNMREVFPMLGSRAARSTSGRT